MVLKVNEVCQVRPAEPVDRLVVVANDADVACGELFDKVKLCVVRVLKLVNKDMRIALAIAL